MSKKNIKQQTPREASAHESVLPPQVAAQYSVRKGLVMKFASADFGVVDLSTINLKFAKRLADKGYLIPHSKKEEEAVVVD